ncbi:MAG: DUF6323 family protein [Peptococcaceae bacterium]|jgi:hypothetical protein|nr:DUF6323 family protein [Peptococcaceae bacterium]
MIKEFCASPYISMHNYADTLHTLVEIFYYYKKPDVPQSEILTIVQNAIDE